MKLMLKGHSERYAVEQLQLCLFPEDKTEYTELPFSGEDGAVCSLFRGKSFLTAVTRIRYRGKTAIAKKRLRAETETVSLRRRILQQSYYLAAIRVLDRVPEWGALAGVRPTKLSTRALLAGKTEAQTERELREQYFVSPERARLSTACSAATVRAAALLEPRDVSLYVGIPFCPTRCAYCSFVSNSIEKCADLMEPFLDCLLRELRFTAELMRGTPYRVRSVYFGGGTPTTLSTDGISLLMDTLSESFDLSGLLEYTVEGGRPDTLSYEKLRAIRERGCGRMSINPQTMNDDVLRLVKRNHSRADVLRSYEDACRAGFDDINMDLIAGLPGDDPVSFRDSVDTLIGLAPTNITVHTLAMKKGAGLFESRGGLPTVPEVEEMLRYSREALRDAGYVPYYLYRQKYMSGSFENIGWCKPGRESLYNIIMMEELHSVLALGGGGMNKLNLPGGRLERIHNPKYPKEYIAQLEDTLLLKRRFFELLGESPQGAEQSPAALRNRIGGI